ncbi:hypothetical protein Purlil1_12261 [Purpureocillium lilacinum]|uniref:Uncharacterized protein n=1 Tax=Purpureocillium lilacinum TaxID=33203 RepID=A0ABR0BIG6_PURLI|nr:hypothetical protein Purlil1_12261 [Purpureocillium lilacinum]
MSTNGSNLPDNTGPGHTSGDERNRSSPSTNTEWSVLDLDHFFDLMECCVPKTYIDVGTSTATTFDHGIQRCNPTTDSVPTDIQIQILDCTRQILARLQVIEAQLIEANDSPRRSHQRKIAKPTRQAGRKRKRRSTDSTDPEIHSVKIKNVFLGGYGEEHAYTHKMDELGRGTWAPTKDSSERNCLDADCVMSMHDDLRIDLQINGGNLHQISVQSRDGAMEGLDAWGDRGLRISFDEARLMLESPKRECQHWFWKPTGPKEDWREVEKIDCN